MSVGRSAPRRLSGRCRTRLALEDPGVLGQRVSPSAAVRIDDVGGRLAPLCGVRTCDVLPTRPAHRPPDEPTCSARRAAPCERICHRRAVRPPPPPAAATRRRRRRRQPPHVDTAADARSGTAAVWCRRRRRLVARAWPRPAAGRVCAAAVRMWQRGSAPGGRSPATQHRVPPAPAAAQFDVSVAAPGSASALYLSPDCHLTQLRPVPVTGLSADSAPPCTCHRTVS